MAAMVLTVTRARVGNLVSMLGNIVDMAVSIVHIPTSTHQLRKEARRTLLGVVGSFATLTLRLGSRNRFYSGDESVTRRCRSMKIHSM